MRQTIRVWVEDKHGALLRVAGIISAKGANIHALTVRPEAGEEGVSIITIVSDLEPRLHQRVVNEMNRLVNVFLAVDLTGSPSETSRDATRREDLSMPPEPKQSQPGQPTAAGALRQEQAY